MKIKNEENFVEKKEKHVRFWTSNKLKSLI